MAKAKKRPSVIDGFASVQAVRRSGKKSGDARTRPSRSKLPALEEGSAAAGKEQAPKRAGAKIGQTAVPRKHDIVCYECSYAFVLSGRITNTICPKCHKSLNVGDHKISKATQLKIQTIGSVEVTPDGKLTDGSNVVARNVIVAGNVKNAKIQCTGVLELCDGAEVEVKNIKFSDLLIRAGSTVSISRKFECRNLAVFGDFKAKVQATGTATVKPGGILRGELYTPHLVVEDGGGLIADVSAGGTDQSKNDKKKRRARKRAG